MNKITTMLVRVKDKEKDELGKKKTTQTGAGDVIVVRAYPHEWTQVELTSDFWCIIDTDMETNIADSYTAREPGPVAYTKVRFKYLDIAKLKLKEATRFEIDSKTLTDSSLQYEPYIANFIL